VRAHWKPILALLLTAPFLTELLSGSLPASVFFRPPVYLFLATVGYGFPILLLREFAMRRQLGLAGWFILGLIYGIFNEGIIAKTFYLAANVPMKNFDGYGYAFGMAIPWAITISIWHALHSFIYPVVAVSCFFPEHRRSAWLNRPAILWLAIPTVAVGTLMFFHQGNDRAAGQPVHFILMIVVSGLLLWLATKLATRPSLGDAETLRTPAIFLGGLAVLALLLAPLLLSAWKIPVFLFYGYSILVVVVMLWLLRRRASLPVNNVLLFAIGDDTLLALFGLAGAIGAGSMQKIVTSVCFLLLFGWVWMWLRKRAGSGADSR
jgi:hypothetical protein